VQTVFRICGHKYLPQDPTGSALTEEGRWHRKGDRVLYFSFSLATCALEIKVHGASFKTIRENCHYSIATIPDGLVEEVVDDAFYIPGWQANKTMSQDYGSKWYREKRSVILRVKSAVIAVESNLIINTLHSDFTRIQFSDPAKTDLDPRLLDF